MEKNWILQAPNNISFNDTQEEWDILDKYMREKNKTLIKKNPKGIFKVSRKELNTFLQENPELKNKIDIIQHSFIIILDKDDPNKFNAGVIARSKAYELNEKQKSIHKEGILGFGKEGRVNPIKFRNDDGTFTIKAIKTLDAKTFPELNGEQISNEFRMMKVLGYDVHFFTRDRGKNTNSDWIGNSKMSEQKGYVLMPLASGEPLSKLKINNKLEAYNITLEIAKKIKAMHDKHIVHNDLHADNILVEKRSSENNINVSIIDFNGSEYTDLNEVIEQSQMNNDLQNFFNLIKLGPLEIIYNDLESDAYNNINDVISDIENKTNAINNTSRPM